MEGRDLLWRVLRGAALLVVVVFFLFPIAWIVLISFETNDQVLQIPPTLTPSPTLGNYVALLSGKLTTATRTMDITFLHNLWNSLLLSGASVGLALILGVPATYAFARFRFRDGEDVAFTLLSFRFAPPLLVPLPLSLYFQDIGLSNAYIGLIWVYQLICLPLILWIARGYFEDSSPDVEYAYWLHGHSWWSAFTKIVLPLAGSGIASAGLLSFIFAWSNFVFALILASGDKQPVTVGALAFVTALGTQYGIIAATIVLSILPTLALHAQCWLVEGFSLGAMKG